MGRIPRRFSVSVAAASLALTVMFSPAVVAAAAPRVLGLPNLLPPIGAPDSYSTPYHTELVVDPPGILANDTDLDSPDLEAVLVSGPSDGTLEFEANGHFHYMPDPGFDGVDKFKYRPFDGDFQALLAVTVTITVAKPVATPTPRPTPTPQPTATPTPRPTPTATPTATPRPTPTPTPGPTLPLPTLPLPTLPPLPLLTPTPTPTPPGTTPTPTPTGGPMATPTPVPAASDGPSSQPDPSASSGPGAVAVGSSSDGNGPPPPAGLSLAPSELAGGSSSDGPSVFGSFGSLGLGIEWVVPTLLLTVPGFLLLLIGLAQVFGGLIWLPLARRWLRGDGRPMETRRSRLTN